MTDFVGVAPLALPIRATVGLAWRVFARAPWTFVGLNGLPVAVGLIPVSAPFIIATHDVSMGVSVIAEIVEWGLTIVLQGATIMAASQIMDTGQVELGTALSVGVRRMLPLALTTFLLGMICTVGFFLLVIPAVIASNVLAVSIPVCIVETLGPMASLRRSRDLTRGNRWRIFGLFALCAAPIFAYVLTVIIGGAFAMSAMRRAIELPDLVWLVGAYSVVVISVAVFFAFAMILPTVLLYQLRDLADPAS